MWQEPPATAPAPEQQQMSADGGKAAGVATAAAAVVGGSAEAAAAAGQGLGDERLQAYLQSLRMPNRYGCAARQDNPLFHPWHCALSPASLHQTTPPPSGPTCCLPLRYLPLANEWDIWWVKDP